MTNDLAPELSRRNARRVRAIQHAVERMMLEISLYTQVQMGIRIFELRHRSKIKDTPRNRRSGEPDTFCDIVMTAEPGRLRTGSRQTSDERHEAASSIVRPLHEKNVLAVSFKPSTIQ
ncbi:hypothetical protein V3C99_018029 [Haemonchus contortus]|uniref:Resolvase/invertase-type recombinase catalytic domain-containing protein n=1 Tax=Haemonchus contortus TaxID=6289 RepID=A0A7I4Z4M0_HAECO